MRYSQCPEDGYVYEEDVKEFIKMLKDMAEMDKDENTIKYLMLSRTLQAMVGIE